MTVKIKKNNCLKIIQIFCDKVRYLLPFCVFRIIQVFSVLRKYTHHFTLKNNHS